MSSLFEGIHNTLTAALSPIYMDASYIRMEDTSGGGDFDEPVETPVNYDCLAQIDDGSIDLKSNTDVVKGEKIAMVLVKSLAIKPAPQDILSIKLVGEQHYTPYTVIEVLGTDPTNVYYRLRVA